MDDVVSLAFNTHRPASRHPTKDFQFDTIKLHNESDVRLHAAALGKDYIKIGTPPAFRYLRRV